MVLAEQIKTAKPDFSNSFGLPLSFDVSKLDPKASPRQDFSRYAAGCWLAAATIPSDRYAVSGVELMLKNVENQVQATLEDATARRSSIRCALALRAAALPCRRRSSVR